MNATAPFLTSLPPQHPQRALLHNEIHARPPEAIEAPVASTHIVMWTDAAAGGGGGDHQIIDTPIGQASKRGE